MMGDRIFVGMMGDRLSVGMMSDRLSVGMMGDRISVGMMSDSYGALRYRYRVYSQCFYYIISKGYRFSVGV